MVEIDSLSNRNLPKEKKSRFKSKEQISTLEDLAFVSYKNLTHSIGFCLVSISSIDGIRLSLGKSVYLKSNKFHLLFGRGGCVG